MQYSQQRLMTAAELGVIAGSPTRLHRVQYRYRAVLRRRAFCPVTLRARPDHLAHFGAVQVHHDHPTWPNDMDVGGQVVARVDHEAPSAHAQEGRHWMIVTCILQNPSA